MFETLVKSRFLRAKGLLLKDGRSQMAKCAVDPHPQVPTIFYEACGPRLNLAK